MKQRKQRRDKIARLISWGHWFTFFNIILVLAIGSLYIEAAEPPGSGLGLIYMLLNWLGHFSFLPFVVFIVLIFPFCLLVPYSRVLRGIATLVAALGIIALVADLLFYRQYGYHLNTYSLSQLAADAESVFAGASFLILLGMLLTFVVLLVFELALANLAWKRLDRLQQKHWGPAFSAVFVLCFLASHSIHVWADAVLYTNITKQDDTFPLSYPTTAKTLMSKHGLLVEERHQATDRLLRQTTSIDLKYPAADMMCARIAEPPTTLIVAFTQLNQQQQQQFSERFPQLQHYGTPVLGQLDAASGLFELLYGLPDLYMTAIADSQAEPAYFGPLRDYRIEFTTALFNNPATADDAIASNMQLPQPLQQFRQFGLSQPSAVIGLAISAPEHSDSLRRIQQALDSGMAVIVTALAASTAAASDPAYAVSAMQVPLWTNDKVNWQAQPLASLTDIMPTVLSNYLQCVEDTKHYSLGHNLQSEARRWPLVTTYGEDLVIYQEEMTSVIDRDGHIRSFDNQSLQLLPGVSPATPVMIDSLRKLKRFNQQNESNP
ncbi:MAG: Inner membrane protein YejM [Pseudidiomarina mangrovi]|nr:MAG: Inner membrane protein YejM [Pseudidiomarina mangrovi]